MQTLLGGGSSGGGGGGGAVAVSPKEVNFYDYDGNCVHAYTVAEAQKLSELPAGPEHPGLVFQGWNWSLEGVKSLTRAMNIGAMYTTDDGTTRLYITLQEGRTCPMLGVGVNGTVTVDWGDGTEPDVLTGTSTSTTKWTPNHAYANPGDYVIRLTVSGGATINGNSNSSQYSNIMRHSSGSDMRNMVYQNSLKAVEIGDGMSIGTDAFYRCRSLEHVSVPSNGFSLLQSNMFKECSNLRYVTVPDSATSSSTSGGFESCSSLITVSLPNTITKVPGSMFKNCAALKDITLPDSVNEIAATEMFYGCNNIKEVVVPDGVAKIQNSTFNKCASLESVTIPNSVTSIGSSAFNECYCISKLKMPNSVTSIVSGTFSYCSGMKVMDFTEYTVVPSLSSTITGFPADCEIRVPAALYDEWIAATNWATYASQIKAY